MNANRVSVTSFINYHFAFIILFFLFFASQTTLQPLSLRSRESQGAFAVNGAGEDRHVDVARAAKAAFDRALLKPAMFAGCRRMRGARL